MLQLSFRQGVVAALGFAASLVCAGASCERAAAVARVPIDLRPFLPQHDEFMLVGAGDIASCGNDDDEDTAVLVEGFLAASKNAVAFTAGDNVYSVGAPEEFERCYAPTWGRFKERTLPTPGNHDYLTENAKGYFGYFGARAGDPSKGYYDTVVGDWHVIVLNSECARVGGCGKEAPQQQWLKAQLQAKQALCTVAIWHHPRFSSGAHGSDPRMAAAWQILDDAGAELVLAGHDHTYERFVPMRADATISDEGLRSIVVGTGGATGYPFLRQATGSTKRINSQPGILALTLEATGYRYRFVLADGTVADEGAAACR